MAISSPRLVFLLLVLACTFPVVAQEVTAFDVNVSSSIVSLPFRVIDAEFSPSLNAIVAVSEMPNQLHIYRPETGQLESVNLQVVPKCVSVRPDGQRAAVGHDAWISEVDLVNATLIQTISVPAVISDIVMAGNGWVYAFPETDQWVELHSVNLATGQQSVMWGIYERTIGRLHPGGTAIYGADTVVSPADIEKYDISGGAAAYKYDSPYHGDYAMCGNLWFSTDGLRIFTACGNVFRSSQNQSEDMLYAGKLANSTSIQWVTHSQAGNNIAVLPRYASNSTANGEIQYYTHDFLAYRGKAVLPRFSSGQTTFASHGKWVFFNAAGTKQYIVVQADTGSGILYDYGVVTIDCTNASVTPAASGASFGTSSATSQFAVTGTAGCGWSATSNAQWLTTTSSGVGDGTVSFTVAANSGVAARTAAITVGGATFTVTQAGAVPSSLVATATSPTSVSLTWTCPVSVDHFEVWRSSSGAFTLVGMPQSAAFTDTAAPDTGYVYKVRAVSASGATSVDSLPDFTHTFTMTDPLLTAGMIVKAAHVTQLRAALNAIRGAAGVSATAFTDPSLPGVAARRTHVTELRDSINSLRSALALAPASFSTLPIGDVIRASTTEELRAAIR